MNGAHATPLLILALRCLVERSVGREVGLQREGVSVIICAALGGGGGGGAVGAAAHAMETARARHGGWMSGRADCVIADIEMLDEAARDGVSAAC